MKVKRTFALWLMPTGKAYYELASLIIDLSKKYGSPPFAPHVTLLGGLSGRMEEILSRTSNLSANLRPYTINLTRIEYLDEDFRCLFIRVQETEEVIQANTRTKEIFDRRNDPKYLPHLSILYGNFSSTTKEVIIEKVGRNFELSFEVDKLHLVDTSGRPESWFTEKEFPLGMAKVNES